MVAPTIRPQPSVGDLDRASLTPLHRQLYARLRAAILGGHLPVGARLPSTRALAHELDISRTTALAAYDQLHAEGYVNRRVGAGTTIAAVPTEIRLGSRSSGASTGALSRRGALLARTTNLPDEWSAPGPGLPFAFRVGVPALDAFPYELWARLLARRARWSLRGLADYQAFGGLASLRKAIAARLAIARGVHCEADQVIVFSGAQAALDLVARVLLDPGDAAWVEEPGHLGAKGALLGAGAQLVPVPVDRDGLDVAAGLARCPDARLAFVTPSHQFPLGIPMSLARRLALLDWARQSGAWLIEDDYDSEYRYGGRSIEALHALDSNDRVIYVGTFSKVMFPSLRLGYLVVPQNLVDAFIAARRFADKHPPTLEQAGLADFIDEGHLGRHIRRMKTLYAERSTALIDAAARHVGSAIQIEPPTAGMHVVGWLPVGSDEAAISERAAALGVEARPVSLYCLEQTSRPGLVLGYGAVDIRQIERAMGKLASAIRSAATCT